MAPDPLRWRPLPMPAGDVALDFIEGLRTWVVNGDVAAQTGMAAHLVVANRSMTRRAFVDADGEILIVPQQGRLAITTELGRLDVAPGEIALIPRGMRLVGRAARRRGARLLCARTTVRRSGLPELGPIGSNGLANARDFLAPVAAVDDAPRRMGAGEEVRRTPLARDAARARPSTSSPGTATSRPTSTTPRASW